MCVSYREVRKSGLEKIGIAREAQLIIWGVLDLGWPLCPLINWSLAVGCSLGGVVIVAEGNC